MQFGPPVYEGDQDLIGRVSGALGVELTAVKYLMPVGTIWPRGRADDKVHEVDHGLQLFTRAGAVVSVSWAMDGLIEGLCLEVRSEPVNASSDDLIAAIDVTGLQEWGPLVGRPLRLTGLATHIPSGTNRATVWSVRFESTNAANVVIALGEADGPSLGYMPDNILAIFDESVARAFFIPGNSVSAWGADT
jgi:hypothetical protein